MFQGRAQISASCRRAVPVIHVQGSHYEVGFDVGRTFSALIKDFISSYENLRTFEKEYKSEAGREAYDKTLANMRRRYPYYVKEMQGIADGAGVPFQQLFLLQLDDIIGTINENSVSRNDTGGCSSIAFHSNKHTYLGHTEDAFSETLNHFYIMSAHIIPTPEDKEAGGRAQISASCRRAVPVIHVQGSHYEVGFDVGRTFSALIKDFISSYENLRTFEKEYKSEAGREAYDKTLANMRRRYPYYVKEMQGIADGAGVPFQQLFLLQLDDIIGTINENSVSRNDTGGCSSIAFHSNKHTYLGHTEDAFSETLNHFYIMSAHIIPTPEDKEAGGVDEDDELSLDEAMQRAVWGAPSAPPAAAPPDSAPPPPLPPLPSPAGGGGGGGGGGGSGLDERSAGGRKLSLQEVRAPPAYEDATRGGAGGGAGGAGGATVNVGRRAGGDRVQSLLPEDAYQALYDRQPHSVFVQLDELLGGDSHEATWQQRARWIKYEQDVEEGAARWGRPHVASLSFHSLLNLRRCLEQGVVLLDLQQEELGGAAQAVVAAMADARLIAADDAPLVLRSLLLRHRHVHDDRSFRFSISGRKHSSYTSLQSKLDGQRRRSSHALPPERKKSLAGLMTGERKKSLVGLVEAERKKSAAGSLSAASHDELKRAFADPVLRRIPEDAEATTVLVGAVNFLEQPTIAFVRLARGILMPDVTEVPVPVRFMFVLLGPEDADLDYREVGRSISTLMSDPTFHALAYRADDRGELLSGINEFLDDSIVLPPGDWERPALLPVEELRAKSEHIRRRKLAALERRASLASPASLPADKQALLDAEAAMPTWPPPPPADPLAKTGRLFGGVVRDMRRRYPLYVSDFTDALSGQCAAAAIFMYFAALSSAITFGGLYAEKTRGLIGISETLVFTMGGGVVFALAAGQPLMITGATGPLLLLDDSLAAFCRARDLDLLAVRAAAAVWMLLFALLVAAAEGSRAVKLITRFTEDIFAFLISLIFISEPITNLVSVYRTHPLGVEYAQAGGNATSSNPDPAPPQPNTALFCTMLTLGTFIIAYYLRIFRNSKFLGRSARRALGDFGVPLAIVAMVGVSAAVPAWTERLRVPAGLRPTAARGWLDPLRAVVRLPAWLLAGAALPALMVYIIVFMETHIAELIVAKPERGLRKGSGLHLDIVVMSLVNVASGACGAPWLCVATVRSVSHVAALTLMSTNHAPGEKPYIVDVKEQRVTGLVVSVLVGLSVLAARFLRLVPMAVLFGVFLYMGISSLAGIQFWERCVLLLKPVKHHPQVAYVRRVPTLRMHLFTLVQAAGLALLYAVKSSRASLALPFFLLLMIPLRMSLARVFTPLQLRALDGRQPDLDCKDDEPDFYEEARLP